MASVRSEHSPKWQQLIWFGSGTALFLTIACLLALVGWTVLSVLEIIRSVGTADTSFLLSGMGIITLTLLRFLAVLVGGAVCFAGIAVSFFASKNASTLDVGTGVEGGVQMLPRIALATYSPGLVGVVVGALVIVAALYAKSSHTFPPPIALYQTPAETTEQIALPPPDNVDKSIN